MKISNLYKEIFLQIFKQNNQNNEKNDDIKNRHISWLKKINHLINIIINLKIQEIVEIPFKVTRI